MAIALLATPALAKTEHLRGCLVRALDEDGMAVDADAKGKIDLETKDRKGVTEVKLRIQAQKLTDIATVDFVLFEDDDLEVEDATMLRAGVTVEDGSAVLTLKTKDGDLLEDGAEFATIADTLGGGLVGVLVGGTEDVILVGLVPVPTKGKKKDKTKSRVFGDDEKAKVTLEWHARKGRTRLSLKTKQDAFVEGDVVTFLLVWDDDGEETFVLGTATANEEGQVKLKLRTDHGDPLPLLFLGDYESLGGKPVRIFVDNDGDGEADAGTTVVEGTLPTF
jgi:hypothetical protein